MCVCVFIYIYIYIYIYIHIYIYLQDSLLRALRAGSKVQNEVINCCYSVAKSDPTLCDPMDCSTQACLSFTISWSLLKLMCIELMMPTNHLILCCPFLLPSIFPSIRVFSNESALHIRWPKYWAHLRQSLQRISSVQFSYSVVSNSLQPRGLQHARLPCPSPTPGACSDLCPSQWCHPTVSSSAIPFSFCLQSFPAYRSSLRSQFFVSSGQSIGASASASVLPKNIQDDFL